jgi:hypothetical protein
VQGAKHDAGDVLMAQGVRERAQRDVHRMMRSVLCPRAVRRVPSGLRQTLPTGPVARAAACAFASEFKPQLLQATTPPVTQYLAQTRDLASDRERISRSAFEGAILNWANVLRSSVCVTYGSRAITLRDVALSEDFPEARESIATERAHG